MSKRVDSLVEDIDAYIRGVTGSTSPEAYDAVFHEHAGEQIAAALRRSLAERRRDSALESKTIRASSYGRPCRRQLWYEARPDKYPVADLEPHVLRKFSFGDMLEQYVLFLARAAGHDVSNEQECVEIKLRNGWKMVGHMDARIDGEVVDVKSCSKYSFAKFKEHRLRDSDSFGYLPQIAVYANGDERAHFLAVEKTLGHMHLDTYHSSELPDPIGLANAVTADVERSTPPDRGFHPIPDGKSGNMKLGVECSYCAFKQHCWPGVRAFLYSNGPKFLVRVAEKPRVPEVPVE